jgi:hypothetical protein
MSHTNCTKPEQIATFPNADLGIVSIVTKISRGYSVALIDSDSEQIVGVYIYPFDKLADAVNRAKKLSNLE